MAVCFRAKIEPCKRSELRSDCVTIFQVLQKIAASIENGEFAQNERKTATQLLQEVYGQESNRVKHISLLCRNLNAVKLISVEA